MRFFVQVNPIMIWYQINSPQFQKELERKKKATTNICALYGKDIFPMKIKVTNLLEQNELVSEIETRLSVCDKLEQTIEDSLKKAGALRQSILKKAFEGELTKEWREAHPELISGENSAKSLLASIREEKARLADEVKKRRSGKAGKK
jgi:type I restriction enzyme S subunit